MDWHKNSYFDLSCKRTSGLRIDTTNTFVRISFTDGCITRIYPDLCGGLLDFGLQTIGSIRNDIFLASLCNCCCWNLSMNEIIYNQMLERHIKNCDQTFICKLLYHTWFLHLDLSHLQASAQLRSAVLQGHAPLPLFRAHCPEQEQFTLSFSVPWSRKKQFSGI